MDIHEAAKKFYESLNAPLGSVNVIPIQDTNGNYLLIWVSPNYSKLISSFPQSFAHYRVVVEKRPSIIAQRSTKTLSFLSL